MKYKAKRHGVKIYFYGPALAVNFLASLLFYPIACRMVPPITCRQSISMSIFMIAVCKVLFGTLALVTEKIPFIVLSYGIQVIEGIGVALLLASTFVKTFSQVTEKTGRNSGIVQVILIFGLAVGCVCGEAINYFLGFSIPFYIFGTLFALVGVTVAIFLPEPDARLSYTEIPIVSWMKNPRMLIYFLVVFTTLNYTGFLIVALEPYLRQFHLNKIFIGALFSITPFVCGISAPIFQWVTRKGVNSVLLICISCFFIFASLILIGPVPFTDMDPTLLYVSIALLLNGLGTGGKLACVNFAAKIDLRKNRYPLIVPTILACGSLLGCFSGSLTASFVLPYLGIGTSTYILLGMEALIFAVCFVFAFNRNYVSQRTFRETQETRPILERPDISQ
ncbi:hypothetical protein JTE90_020685 [Oedothorax gibbosus]|uniref:Major facilitator superfamily (MFS) profile domain-containing protein n=1 Tax=Oedothorax gibbosus TaxID=931172 RepID=A0AAV6V5P1_9ARAC|nr:hypothetical protein JTE90_020685 [Oedothorax gibbosus]